MNDVNQLLADINRRLERIEEHLSTPTLGINKTWFTVAEAAKLLERQPFTVREWCRNGRIHAEKRSCGRGQSTEWVISLGEIERYTNEGLLPIGTSLIPDLPILTLFDGRVKIPLVANACPLTELVTQDVFVQRHLARCGFGSLAPRAYGTNA